MTDPKISKHWINTTLNRVRIFSFWTRNLPELPTNSNDVGGWLAQNKILSKYTEKGFFYFTKTEQEVIVVADLLHVILPKTLAAINWKKSMRPPW